MVAVVVVQAREGGRLSGGKEGEENFGVEGDLGWRMEGKIREMKFSVQLKQG